MKFITINNVKYKINCNALTYLYHKKIFDCNIFKDINIIREFLVLKLENNKTEEEKNEILIKKLDSYINSINKLTYSAIYTQKKDIEEYEEWIKKNQVFEEDNNCATVIIKDIIDCFIDETVSKELENMNKNSGDNIEVLFPEHHFLSACLKIGITIKDLENLTYIDVVKIFLSCTQKKITKIRKATQADWDRLASRGG